MTSISPSRRATLSRLAMGLFIATTAVLIVREYVAFRVDHTTQVPLLLKQIDPSLYPRDWFLSEAQGHLPVRRVFLAMELAMLKLLPEGWELLTRVALVLFAQYYLYLMAFVGALWLLTRRLGHRLPFLIVWLFLLCALDNFANLGKTQLIEEQTIPRMYAYAGVLLALPLLLRGGPWRALAAGAVMGLTGLVQGAPPLQAIPFYVVWLLWGRGWRRGGLDAIVLVVSFAVCYSPQTLLLKNVVAGANPFSPEEVILYSAYLRHPHHMLPLEFSRSDYFQAMVLFLLVAACLRFDRPGQARKRLVTLICLLLIYFLVAPLFIHVWPVAGWIEFQPFRQFATLRILLLALVARQLVQSLGSGDRLDVARAVLILAAALKSYEDPAILTAWFVVESIILLTRSWSPRHAPRVAQILPLLAMLAWWPAGRSRFAALVALYCLIAYAPGAMTYLRGAYRRLAGWKPLLPISSALCAAFLALILLWPFRNWDKPISQWSKLDHLHYRLTNSYQVYPYPMHAIELAATWAKHNTPADALFVIPPDRAKESFHIWSDRSIVFNAKTFPYLKTEWPTYLERYRVMSGVLDDSNAEDIELLMRVKGGRALEWDFRRLDPITLTGIMERYGADYLITQAGTLIDSAYMNVVAGPFVDLAERYQHDDDDALYVFRPSKPTDGATTDSEPWSYVEEPEDMPPIPEREYRIETRKE